MDWACIDCKIKKKGKEGKRRCVCAARDRPRRSLEERFWDKVNVCGANECWLWKGSKARGYGRISLSDRGRGAAQAHRISWEIHYGSIPDGLYVCHKCDVRACVNPNHLFLGTPKDNQQDMVRKGRCAMGETHPQTKFKKDDIIKIRKLYATGKFTQREIARRFEVKRPAISRILSGKRWGHVKEGLA